MIRTHLLIIKTKGNWKILQVQHTITILFQTVNQMMIF